MQINVDQEIPNWGQCTPHVLVVNPDVEYGQSLVAALRDLSVRAKHTKTVDEFLDLNCGIRVDLVSVEIDPTALDTLDHIKLLRTHFGEGPGTRIVASSAFVSSTFLTLVEQRGADVCMTKLPQPEAMAATLNAELHKQME